MVFNFLLIYGVVVMVESVKSLLTQSDVLVHSLFFWLRFELAAIRHMYGDFGGWLIMLFCQNVIAVVEEG